MKKILFGLSLLVLTCGTVNLRAQNYVTADDESNLSNFYKREIASTKKALPYPHLRESDVIWETCIWRTVDFREKFNQFFYFPKGTDTIENNQGRINLTWLLVRAVRNGDITVYDDDELKTPLGIDDVEKRINKQRHGKTDAITDEEYGDILEEGHDTIIPVPFTPEDYYQIKLKEYWYIDKQDTRMKVRIIGLCLVDDNMKEDEDGGVTADPKDRFWVPLNDMAVRNLLAKANAYDMYNNSLERSYDEIFISRYFDSYITRETNVYNRNIHDYLTGEDAQLESNAIEERIFDIESDMWEY
jgi:gliding motility associated protien GldN